MLQCSSHQQLTDNPGIDNILLSIHDSIGFAILCVSKPSVHNRVVFSSSESFFLRLLLSNGHTAIVGVRVSVPVVEWI